MVKASYSRSSSGGVSSSKQATRYAANRKGTERDQGSREIYDQNGLISKEQAYANIERADQGGDRYHYRLTLSHVHTGEGVDHHATTRDVMRGLEERHANQGSHITWHAVNHTDHSKHEHTHVIAVTERRINATDLSEMRRELDRSYERHTHREIEHDRGGVSREAYRENSQQATSQNRSQSQNGQERITDDSGNQRAQATEESHKRTSKWWGMDWEYSREQIRDERYLADGPSMMTSDLQSRQYLQYKHVEAMLPANQQEELHMREMEWRREQQAAGREATLDQAYWKEQDAVLQDMQRCQHMPASDQRLYMDNQADERWRDRQVNERGLRGDELGQAYRERYDTRKAEREALATPQRQLRWGESRRQQNTEQAQRQERQSQAWSERPRRQRQQPERQQHRDRGGPER